MALRHTLPKSADNQNRLAMAFTDIFIKRPVLSVVVSLLILLIGLRAATVLPIRQYPNLSNTVVTVTTAYPALRRGA